MGRPAQTPPPPPPPPPASPAHPSRPLARGSVGHVEPQGHGALKREEEVVEVEERKPLVVEAAVWDPYGGAAAETADDEGHDQSEQDGSDEHDDDDEQPPPPPPPWETHFDPASGLWYYWNTQTEEARWELEISAQAPEPSEAGEESRGKIEEPEPSEEMEASPSDLHNNGVKAEAEFAEEVPLEPVEERLPKRPLPRPLRRVRQPRGDHRRL